VAGSDFCRSGGRGAIRAARAFRILLSALIVSPAGLAAYIPGARSQGTASSGEFTQSGWFAVPAQGSVAPARTNIFHVTAAIHDQVADCLGEQLHGVSASLAGDNTVVAGFLNQMGILNEAAKSVCYSDLYAKLGTGQQALVIQRVKVANTCVQDAESALSEGDSQTAAGRIGLAITSFQAAGQILVQGADRYLTLSASGEAVRNALEAGLGMLGVPGKEAIIAKGLIENAAAHHLLGELLTEMVSDGVEKATLDAAHLDDRVAGALAKSYDHAVNQKLGGFVGSYQCQ
jgi:hypothetical protein